MKANLDLSERAKRLKGDLNEEALKQGLVIARENRQFEIELLWKRTLAFAGFVAALFIAFTQTKPSDPILTTALVLAGIVMSTIWSLANRASKSWQESWELKVKAYSEILGLSDSLYSREEQSQKGVFPLLRPARYSVSRLLMAVSDYSVIVWVALALHIFIFSDPVGCQLNKSEAYAFALFNVVYLVYVFAACRSRSDV